MYYSNCTGCKRTGQIEDRDMNATQEFYSMKIAGKKASLVLNRDTGETFCRYTVSLTGEKGIGTPPAPQTTAEFTICEC